MLEQTAAIRQRRCSSRKLSTFFFFYWVWMSQSFPYRRFRSGIWARSFTYLDNLHQRDRKVFQREAKHGWTWVCKHFASQKLLHFSQILNMKHAALLLLWADFQKLSLISLKKNKSKASSQGHICQWTLKLHSHRIRRCVQSREGCGRSLELMHCVADTQMFFKIFF